MRYFLIFMLFIFINSSANSQDTTRKTKKLFKFIQKHHSLDGDNPTVNILAYLKNAKNGFVFHEGIGRIDRIGGEGVSKDQTFKVASITKMFTAVIILQLAEESKIDLDSSVYSYLKNIDYLEFEQLHLFGSQSYGKQITIRQLLSHRSGLADLFVDREEAFNTYVLSHKQESWSPEKLFSKYYEFGLNKMAKFKPGRSYAYSDVGYFLLGLCIEQLTKTSLATQYRKRIIEPLNMQYTYFEYEEQPMKDIAQAHAYVGQLDATLELNTSYDWAGGGLVSNTYDLNLFIENLFKNNLFAEKETLESMINDKMYGYGISVFDFRGKTYYGHLGFWGSGVFYNCEDQITIVLSINQTSPTFNVLKFVTKIMKIVEQD